MVSLLPSSFQPFASCLYLIQQWLNITCIWYSEPQHRISDLFDLSSIVSLHRPSTHRLLAFHFNITYIWYSEPQNRIFDLFDLLSIISLHCPSTHRLLAFRFNFTCIWYSKPQHRISDLLVYYLSSPSIILLPIIFWPFACCCIWFSEPQPISDLFDL